jgi:hypothetical protein
MANHPINLALRFVLELIALFALGYWGWTQHTGILRYLWAFGLPLIAAVVWGVFRAVELTGPVPAVAVPGPVRLLIEFAVFGSATWAFYAAGRSTWALVFGGVVLLHYVASYDRLAQLLGRR